MSLTPRAVAILLVIAVVVFTTVVFVLRKVSP
jgi:hypothetical protein